MEFLDDIKEDQILQGHKNIQYCHQNCSMACVLANIRASLDVKKQLNHNSTSMECQLSNKSLSSLCWTMGFKIFFSLGIWSKFNLASSPQCTYSPHFISGLVHPPVFTFEYFQSNNWLYDPSWLLTTHTPCWKAKTVRGTVKHLVLKVQQSHMTI